MVFQFVVLQIHMCSLLSGLQTCVFCLKLPQGPYHMSAKALARLYLCAGLPEPFLFAYVICTLFSCAGSYVYM